MFPIKYEGFLKEIFDNMYIVSLKKFPITRAAQAQKVTCPYISICQIYICHWRIVINSDPFHPP